MFRIGNCNSKYINEKTFILCNVLIDKIFILNFVILSRAIPTHFYRDSLFFYMHLYVQAGDATKYITVVAIGS